MLSRKHKITENIKYYGTFRTANVLDNSAQRSNPGVLTPLLLQSQKRQNFQKNRVLDGEGMFYFSHSFCLVQSWFQ